jgi:hypothetical protein
MFCVMALFITKMTGKRNKTSPRKNHTSVPRHHFAGKEIKVPSLPTEFTSRPWYPLVVRFEAPSTNVTATQIGANIISQLGIVAPQGLNFRLQSVRFWGALISPGSTVQGLNPVTLNVLDFISQTSATVERTLEQYIRYPDQVNRASVGFEYPDAHKCLSISSVQAMDILRISNAGPNSVLYFHLHWRTGATNAQTLAPYGYAKGYDMCG